MYTVYFKKRQFLSRLLVLYLFGQITALYQSQISYSRNEMRYVTGKFAAYFTALNKLLKETE